MASVQYQLLYWPGIPGRGEFIRLAFEATGTPYHDQRVVPAITSLLAPGSAELGNNPPPLAPPMLKDGSLLISQTSNILSYLGDKLNLAPKDDGKYHVHQIACTALDYSDEVHNVHHPIAAGLYYEDQKEEAMRAAKEFTKTRVAKFWGWFERNLEKNAKENQGSEWMVGRELSYADLVVWQVVDGTKFAFPKAAQRVLENCPLLVKHYEKVKGLERIKSYLESERRLPYSNGVFRYYEELDL
ncbi:glutathione S-transferase [Pyronema omphalodes]|nr:glutathione S-transferase [Pyronema omphalodes]